MALTVGILDDGCRLEAAFNVDAFDGGEDCADVVLLYWAESPPQCNLLHSSTYFFYDMALYLSHASKYSEIHF